MGMWIHAIKMNIKHMRQYGHRMPVYMAFEIERPAHPLKGQPFFYIKIKESFIGLQIKPVSSGQSINQYQWIEMHEKNHQRFKNEFGGNVFFIYSIKASGKKKKIYNTEVIEEIKAEIIRLKE